MYHCRQIANTVDELNDQWDVLVREEQKSTVDAEVRVRIENEKMQIVDLVEEVL